MSVYTHLTQQDIEQLLIRYDLGNLTSFQGIESGVENTNYFLDIDNKGSHQRYVLTLFEYLPADTLPFFIQYTDELKAFGLPVPNPIRDMSGAALQSVKGKPALIVQCFAGQHPDAENLSLDQCQQIGAMLAKIHKAGQGSSLYQENQRGLAWLDAQQKRLIPLLGQDDAHFMAEQWQNISDALQAFDNLPTGLIHGDLFHNNVLFDQGRISAVIDFYQACNDWLIYDLAVTVNDWCLTDTLELDSQRLKALTESYAQVRPFTENEQKAWPIMLRLAAFRFWISRLITFVHPETQADNEQEENLLRHFLDPNKFRDMLRKRTKLALAELS
ncbi:MULTISPECIES: homoserine kinase [Gammaproteobacteria]|uniref:homoserine kinase n=1 Tax=Gammaproteobacteria TaxID=1236 RepID=UPI001ADB5A24|nr:MULTISPECIES: homoserine kinase [Gammaproteobacteria]MBO9480418.1 homoserine kinase [Salinisphaera sp. G21_0]MBO9493657.1 homoserine kinase [Thalassotalea sp. G20_0]